MALMTSGILWREGLERKLPCPRREAVFPVGPDIGEIAPAPDFQRFLMTVEERRPEDERPRVILNRRSTWVSE